MSRMYRMRFSGIERAWVFLVAVLIAGCSVLDIIKQQEPEPVPLPATNEVVAVEEPAPVINEDDIRGGSHILLWKPISESTGNALLMLPCQIRHRDIGANDTDKKCVLIHGRDDQVYRRSKGYGPGNRLKFYMNFPGAMYVTNMAVQLRMRDGRKYNFTLPDPSKRVEIYIPAP